ncbi:hypothetical protein E1264_14080 [Actinomadura sp. KC216]|uniref:hypothetical protein n=1 Tax=Actinomadura sp. KC216 TaxID=2530370 RepID=UPI001052A0DB|nr:hypothetical protein [Actinomadura sp. KC216]TDB87608.1 hypothetical protein E1264_14080 [Actinomadura sp. KC216]
MLVITARANDESLKGSATMRPVSLRVPWCGICRSVIAVLLLLVTVLFVLRVFDPYRVFVAVYCASVAVDLAVLRGRVRRPSATPPAGQ